ncbi:hypothetical protein AB1Y20_014504 [Prymnesium parvum]|uniref:DDE Tnp4 domain-containing protein n=1 Tax=Prymnesium parvum TaxID=97485 RepID=A0AB34IEC6_PRYPA
MRSVCKGFEQLRGFKGCCGCIDGSFVKIRAPHLAATHSADYNTYKKFYAIQILAVCTANFMFTFVFTGAPGSRSDSWLLRRTSLWNYWNQYFPAATPDVPYFYLLGDGGFKLREWLVVPFTKKQLFNTADPELLRRRKAFTRDQTSTRVCIEIAFGILKARWLCLRHGLQCTLGHASLTLDACMVLHNVCIARNDIWAYNHVDDRDVDIGFNDPTWLQVDSHAPMAAPPPESGDDRRAKRTRDYLVDTPRANRR